MARATKPRDVFVNCPFDPGYDEIFYGIVFTIIRMGFVPRCAREADDGAEIRLNKINDIIEESRFGIHDISRTDADGDPPLPRFNMPLELGLFLGAKRFGGASQKLKRCLILDADPYRFRRFISDISGQDIHAHANDRPTAIREVATWLRRHSQHVVVPGGVAISTEYDEFLGRLPAILGGRNLTPADLSYGDYVEIMEAYITRP